MDTTSLILTIVAVIVVAAIAVVGLKIAKQKQSRRLRERYGSEYERAVAEHGDERAAESALRDREKQHRKLDLKDLNQQQRDDYDRRWKDLQAEFVDDPSRAVRGADQLVVEIMKVRGYPVDDFDQRAENLSVDHPETTSRYREARTIARANEDGTADTENLRQAVTSYRELVRALVHGDGRRDDGAEHDRTEHDRTEHDRTDHDGSAQHRGDAARTDTEHERNGHRESVPTQVHETKRETM
jgi:FtsZ-interacting cell division protein ZipA